MESNRSLIKYRSSSVDRTVTSPNYTKIVHHRTTVSCEATFRECGLLQARDPNTLNKEDLNKLMRNDSSTDSEEARNYYAGGYFFATCGQELGDSIKYRIIRKIGYGHFSTVWMATQKSDNKQYHAIKIIRCDEKFRKSGDEEVRLLCYVTEHDHESLGYNRVISIYDFFTRRTTYGTHLCIVYEMMSYTLRDLIDKSIPYGLDEQSTQIIIKQILEGLVYLHKSCKILHSDIKPENIFVVPTRLELDKMASYVNRFNELGVQLPKSCVNILEWKRYADWEGLLEQSNLTSHNDVFSRKSMDIKPFYYNLAVNPNIQIKIGDLGNSCFEKEKSATLIQTIHYRAFEVLIQAGYSFPADMWSVGCMAYEMRTTHYLFNPFQSKTLTSTQLHICLIWEALGDIPKSVALSGKLSKEHFTPEGLLKLVDYGFQVPITIEGILLKKFRWNVEDAKLFGCFIRKLIEPDCIKRFSATKALNHEWLKKSPSHVQAI